MRVKSKILVWIYTVGAIACDGDYYEDLSGEFLYRGEGSDNRSILSYNLDKLNIYSNVISYAYNSDFILAKQKPNYKNHRSMMGAYYLAKNSEKYPTKSIQDQIDCEAKADSILKHDPYYRSIFLHKVNYWIISHENKKLYGPLTKTEFERMRTKLGVSDALRLDED